METLQTMPAVNTPDWLTETPEGSEYALDVIDDAAVLQKIQVSREEYILLKRYLAEQRAATMNFSLVAIDGAKTGKESVSAMERVKGQLVERITRAVASRASILPAAGDSGRLVDLFMLAEILEHWESGSCEGDYPEETPLLASIRVNTGL